MNPMRDNGVGDRGDMRGDVRGDVRGRDLRGGRGDMRMDRDIRDMRMDRDMRTDRDMRAGRGRGRWRGGVTCVRDVMTRNPACASPNEPVQRLAEMMVREDTGIIPITEGDRLIGVVTDRDIVARIVARGLDMRSATARDVMTDDVECVTEQDDLHDVLRLMSSHQIRRVPVVSRGDRLVGIVSTADIAREADLDEELQDTFAEISSERSFWSRLR
jgi:CBS domain-containing protein